MAVIAAKTERSMLGQTWHLEIHGQTVDNVEGLCRSVLNRAASKLARPLEPADYDDALAFLLGEVVVIATERWPPRRGRYPALGKYLAVALPSALIDYWRATRGRTGWKCVTAAPPPLQDVSSSAFDWTPAEPIDDRLSARTEDLVVGRLELLELAARQAAVDEADRLVVRCRQAARRRAPAPA